MTEVSQAKALNELLVAWKLKKKMVVLVSNITTINSGSQKEADTLFEKQFNKNVLHLACWHHILELLVKAVWHVVFGKIKSP